MSADTWFVWAEPGFPIAVLDENRLTVADCGTRREDADRIVREHNAHGELVAALRAIVAEVEGMGAISWPTHPMIERARDALEGWDT